MFKSVAPLLLTTAFLAGCAKEKPYEENTARILNQMKGVEFSKSQLDICTMDDPCLWVPSVADTPYAVSASRPFWQGEEKLVITQIKEDTLEFLQIEEDERYSGNINNFSPVAQFDIEHVDYKCAEDSLGECTNTEVEDDEKPWDKKRYIRLNDFSVTEKNSLPIQFDELFNAGCYQAEGNMIEEGKLKIDKGAINIGLKVDYAANPNCMMLRDMGDLRYLNFTVDYHYSLVKLSELADKTYEKVEYPSTDEAHYGFFKTTKKSKTVDNHDHYMGLRTNLMNRWSPNKSEVVYYLNEDFYKDGMENIRISTVKAIEAVNFSLKQANAKIQIKLADGRGKDIGDIRNNFLVLVSDPQASGVIGYGPSVVNPNTGEILNARTVMYYGTIKKFIARTYDELVEETLSSGDAQANAASAPGAQANSASSSASLVGSAARTLTPHFAQLARKSEYNNFEQVQRAWMSQLQDIISFGQEPIDLSQDVNMSDELKAFKEKVSRLSEQTFFHGSQVNFEDAVKQFILEKKKMWDELTEAERASIIDQLLPSVWVPTLVHEFGHNLGLRHNFYGSTDEENYYTTAERQALGLKRDVTYSSIMDYSYSTLNELSVMGKYDVAALKFAYAREAETKDGGSVKVETTLKSLFENDQKIAESVKRYRYCSDEHVSSDPICNRFDEGKNNVEVVTHYINTYKKNYSKRNFRNRKYDFSGRYGDWSHAISTLNTLAEIRQFFDYYDQRVFRGDYDKTDISDERKEELADLKKASDLAFGALMDIIETPAYHCLELYVQNGQIAGIGEAKPFNEMAAGTKLEEYGITFDIVNGCQFLSYYEQQDPTPGLPPGLSKTFLSFGKYFNNSLDLTVPYDQKVEGDTSQVDVRGYWFDKVASAIFLSSRSQSPTSIGAASNGSFLDYPEYEERFMKFVTGLLTNKFEKEVEVKMGEQVIGKIPLTYSFDSNHKVNKSYNATVNYVFGLENTQTNIKSVVMNHLKKNFKIPKSPTDYNVETFHDFHAAKLNVKVDVSDYNYDKVVEFVDKNGKVQSRFGLYSYNTFGLKLAAKKDALDKILSLSEESSKVMDTALEALANVKTQEEAMKILSAIEDEKVIDIIINHGEELADFKAGTLTSDGLASSFLALTEKGDSLI